MKEIFRRSSENSELSLKKQEETAKKTKALHQQATDLNNEGKYKEAKDVCEKAIKQNLKSLGIYEALTHAYYGCEEYEKALNAGKKACKLGKSATIFHHMAFAYSKQGKLEEALIASNKAIDLKPDNEIYYRNKIFILHSKKKFEETKNTYIDATNRELKLEFKPEDGEICANIAGKLNGDKKYKEARDLCEYAISKKIENKEIYIKLTFDYIKLNENDKVLSIKEDTIEKFKSSALYNNVAWANYSQENYEKAANFYSKAIDMNPECLRYYQNIICSLVQQEKYQQAMKFYNTATLEKKFELNFEIMQRDAKSCTKLASFFNKYKKYDQAREICENAILDGVKSANICVQLIKAHLGLGDKKKARDICNSAISYHKLANEPLLELEKSLRQESNLFDENKDPFGDKYEIGNNHVNPFEDE